MTLVDRSPDLARLVQEEHDVEIRDDNLLVHHVPYVDASGHVARCTLVSEVSTNGERTIEPGRHEVWVVGGVPYDHEGHKISIIADEQRLDYGGGLVASCRLSGKPHGRMPVDYYEKLTTYIKLLGRYARAIDPSATHTGFPARETSASESVFRYTDAASSRAALSAVTNKLRLDRVAIVGLGGTGSYILDLVAKTPVQEVHLFDDDVLYAHNAFRAPGAAALDEIKESPTKVQYYSAKYDAIRRGIFPHPVRLTGHNVGELQEMGFVFLSMDAGPSKREIIEQLVSWGIPFVDTGMGVQRQENSLRGVLRVTTFTDGHSDHLNQRISFQDVDADEYRINIQTADLNMMNAAMAVIRWKKLLGYYADSKQELNSSYTVARNQMLSAGVEE